MSGSAAEGLKGMIPYPCCPKEKIMPYASARGIISNKCPKCGKFAMFNLDTMKSWQTEPQRGAAHKFNIEK